MDFENIDLDQGLAEIRANLDETLALADGDEKAYYQSALVTHGLCRGLKPRVFAEGTQEQKNALNAINETILTEVFHVPEEESS